MVYFICDGCGKMAESLSGFKPDWYARTDPEPPRREWHACSRPCIEKSASPQKLVLPI